MKYTQEEACERYPDVNFFGMCYIGAGAVIGEGAFIGAGTVIRAGADIGAGAYIRDERAFIGEGAVIREGADIGAGAFIRERAVIRAGADIGAGAYIRAGADIGEGAFIRERAYIGEGAVIRAGADIGAGAVIMTISDKYNCNICPHPNGMLIRVGCEMLPIQEFIDRQEELADKHDREWWDNKGKRIFEFLLAEARIIARRLLNESE